MGDASSIEEDVVRRTCSGLELERALVRVHRLSVRGHPGACGYRLARIVRRLHGDDLLAVDTGNVGRLHAVTKAACLGQTGPRHWSIADFDAMQSLVAPRKRAHSDLPIL